MDNNNFDWYSSGSAGDWYADNFPKAPVTPAHRAEQTPPQAPRKPRRKRTGMKVTMIVVCVLVLVVATALAFAEGGPRFGFDYSISGPGFEISSDDGIENEDEDSTSTDVPDSFFDNFDIFDEFRDFEDFDEFGGEEIIIPGEDSDMPGDFRDFFDSYYTMEEKIEPSSIERTEAPGDVEIILHSAKGKEILSLQQLYKKVSPSIVSISTFQNGLSYAWGTGIIADSKGYIITNAHVLSNADACTVTLFNGRELDALLVGSDAETDLAVLKVDAKGLVAADFGDSSELEVGDDVAAIGNPLGAEFIGTLTNGIVSAINRNVDYMGTDMDLIQTNASINEGNSGGALINMYGQIVGITSMKMVNEYGGTTIEGIGFAIPSTIVKEIVDKLIDGGEVRGRPSIGIVSGTVPQQAIEEYGLPEGLYVTEVYEESDAYAKGIQPGDVLTHVNGQKVTTTDEVIAIRDAHQIGDTLKMTIFRGGESFDVDVEIYDAMDVWG